jgi:uncharacterized membrane protein YhiD involved in acid resistance
VQVIQQAAALVDQLQQAAAAVVVLLVGLEVAGELLDAGGQQRDLDFRRTGIVGGALVLFDDLLGVDGHGGGSLVMRDLQERGLSTARTAWSAACD